MAALVLSQAAAPRLLAQNGTWTNLLDGNASGSWSAATNWNNGVIASGADNTADFSTLNLTTNSIVTLDGARTIGNIHFGDTSPDANWGLITGTGGPLTLAVSSGTPTLTGNSGSNTIGAILAGSNGFTKAGPCAIILTGANNATLANNININAGTLTVGNNNALGVSTPNGSVTLSNAVVIASGATLQILGGIQPNLKPILASGDGVGGTQGAIYADLGGLAQGNSQTRLSIGLLNNPSPAMTLLGDTTIRVDGTNSSALSATMLIGHITTSNALTGTPANFTGYTLTKAGTGQLRIDPATGYSGGNIHIAGGTLSWGNNNDLLASQTVTVDAGTALHCRNVNSMNSSNSSLVVNGVLEMNARGNGTGGSDATVAVQTIGYLSGSGVVTNGSAGNIGASTLVIAGTNGTATTFSGIIPQCLNGSIGLRIQNTNSVLRLVGNNTYQGITAVIAGTLLVDGSHLGGGAYTVAAGATLGGAGTISAPITLTGLLQAGDPAGTLTVSNVTGAGDVVVSNANLTVLGQLNNSTSGNLNSLYLNNSVTTFNLQGGLEASIYAATVTVDGPTNLLNVLIANPKLGQFPLIGGVSSLGGLNGFSGLELEVPVGVGAYLSNNSGSIDIVVTNIPSVVWRGTPTGDWSIGGSSNWLKGITPTAYTETAGLGPFVIFDDTASGSASVNLSANVSPRGVTVSSSSKTYTLSGTGGVGGQGSWVKDGSSTFIVANSGPNSFLGPVSILGGTIQIGNGGTTGDLGPAAILNSGSLAFNRSDDVTFPNAISGSGTLVKQAPDIVTLTGIGDVAGAITVSAGTLALAPAGSNTVSGDVTGNGAFGMTGPGTLVLTSGTITYASGTVISNGTLQFNATFPPAGNITDNGTLALAVGGTLANVSGSGGISLINGASGTLGGANTYAGPTVVLGGSVSATAGTFPTRSVLRLGSQTGSAEVGTAEFTAGNPVIGGLTAGGNTSTPNSVDLSSGGQTLIINGNVSVGNISPPLATAILQVTGTGASVILNTNGGTIQIGLGTAGTGVNPDNVLFDLSHIDNFVANLGATGLVNLGTLDGSPGPPAGATAVNLLYLAAVSNSITAGTVTIGAGGRQLIPELRLGAGTNIINTDNLRLGAGSRDGGFLGFLGGTGGVRVRASDGVSRANLDIGAASINTSASITATVDLTGHSADLLLNALVMGSLSNVGPYVCTLSFDQGVLDALSTSLAVLRTDNGNPGVCTLNIGGGTASLGAVSLTTSAGQGKLNINNASVTVSNITSAGTGAADLDINNSTLTLALGAAANPVTAPVAVDTFNPNGTVNLGISGSGFTVGQFPFISYAGAIGGSGFSALNLTSLPFGVSATLSNNVANLSVDVVITAAPPVVNTQPTNLTFSLSGGALHLSWPPDHKGWTLQTNATAITATNAWFAYPGSSTNTNVAVMIDPFKTNVFFRMAYP